MEKEMERKNASKHSVKKFFKKISFSLYVKIILEKKNCTNIYFIMKFQQSSIFNLFHPKEISISFLSFLEEKKRRKNKINGTIIFRQRLSIRFNLFQKQRH